MADGYLNFDTKINEKGFNDGIKKLSSLGKSGLQVAGKALAGITAVLGAGTAAGVKYNATIEQYQTSFEVMTGSAEKAKQVVEKLTKLGASTPFEMTGLAETTQLLMNYGMTADDAMSKMMMLGDISQGNADKLNRIAMAYGQMSSAGKVQLEDIKQMIEAGFNPLQEISQTTGESMESLYDRISKGTISVDEITASMERSTSAGGKYFQSMQKQSQTVMGQLSTLGDNVQQLLGSLTSGVSKILGENILPEVNKFLGSLNDAFAEGGFQGFLDEIGTAVPAVKGLADAAGNLADKLNGMSSDELLKMGKTAATIAGTVPMLMLFGKCIGAVKIATEGFGGITEGIISGIGKMPGAFGGAAKSVKKLGSDFKGIGKSFGDVYTVIGNPTAASAAGMNFSTAMSEVGDSFSPVLKKAAGFAPAFLKCMNIAGGLGVVVAGLGLLYNAFGTQIDQILLMVQTKGPEIITKFCDSIISRLPTLIGQGALLLNSLMLAITANLPAIISGGIGIVSALISGIASQLPTLIPTAVMMVLTIVTSLLSNVGQLVDSGLKLITGLVQGLLNALPKIIAAAPTIIGKLVSAIVSNLPKILQTGVKLIVQLAAGLVSAVPQLIGKIPSIISEIKEAFTSIDWGNVGKNIIDGIANGLKKFAGNIVDAARGAAEKALDGAKKFLGIKSPSRVFRDQVGKMMALGLGIGFEKNIPVKDMGKGVENAVNRLKRDVAITTSVRFRDTVGKIKNGPGFFGPSDQTDYDRLERIQMKAADRMAKRPIYLGTERIDKPLPEGAVPVW